ncbi:hypothetical protein [Salinibacterium sp. ZJ77]|nr:hypothetical protein [Salinibacterium sp. ZJ77]
MGRSAASDQRATEEQRERRLVGHTIPVAVVPQFVDLVAEHTAATR